VEIISKVDYYKITYDTNNIIEADLF